MGVAGAGEGRATASGGPIGSERLSRTGGKGGSVAETDATAGETARLLADRSDRVEVQRDRVDLAHTEQIFLQSKTSLLI